MKYLRNWWHKCCNMGQKFIRKTDFFVLTTDDIRYPNQTSANRGSSSRPLPNHWYLSWVEAWYWKPKIVVTWIPISSLIWICPNTNMLTQILIRVLTFLNQNICPSLIRTIQKPDFYVRISDAIRKPDHLASTLHLVFGSPLNGKC